MNARCRGGALVALALGAAGCTGGAVEGGGGEAVDAGGDEGEDTFEPSACPRARIAVPSGQTLNVREAPTTSSAIVASLTNHAVVTVLDRVAGEEVSEIADWFEIETGPTTGFVSGAFASCTTDEAPELQPPAAYYLPLACGSSATVSQGNNGAVSHVGKSLYAFDFAIGLDTPVVAMADGIVLYTFAETQPGDACYDGGGPECAAASNYVVLSHGDGTGSIYKHLNRVDVTVGQFVASGSSIGLSGSTGYSTGPHAHVMRQEDCGGATSCLSIPLAFADVPGDGVPVTGQSVTSENCASR